MDVKAKLRFLRMSPRKVRLVVDVIRGLKIDQAINQLSFTRKKASLPILKLLNSAVANAKNNFKLDESNLYVKEVRADEGPTLKRWMPRAHGRATMIRKRTSHVSIILSEKEEDKGVAKEKNKGDEKRDKKEIKKVNK